MSGINFSLELSDYWALSLVHAACKLQSVVVRITASTFVNLMLLSWMWRIHKDACWARIGYQPNCHEALMYSIWLILRSDSAKFCLANTFAKQYFLLSSSMVRFWRANFIAQYNTCECRLSVRAVLAGNLYLSTEYLILTFVLHIAGYFTSSFTPVSQFLLAVVVHVAVPTAWKAALPGKPSPSLRARKAMASRTAEAAPPRVRGRLSLMSSSRPCFSNSLSTATQDVWSSMQRQF